MRASGQTVERSDKKRRVGMPLMNRAIRFVKMKMRMNLVAMVVPVLVNVIAKKMAQSPDADSNQQNAYQTLRPERQCFEGEQFPQPEREQANGGDAD